MHLQKEIEVSYIFFKNRNIYIWCMLRKKKYLFIASFPFNTLCTLLREYKTPVPHLKADKRIIAQQDNYAHISHSNI